MKTFHVLKELHEFRRRHLPFLKTVEDMELVREIGLHQARGRPLNALKTLFLEGIGSIATVSATLAAQGPRRDSAVTGRSRQENPASHHRAARLGIYIRMGPDAEGLDLAVRA